MTRILCALFITLAAYMILPAQVVTKAKIENTKATMVDDNTKIEVSFSITHAAKDEKLEIELKFQTGDKFIYPKSISGSISSLSAGNHTIVWDVLKDLDELEGDIKPIVTITETNYKLKAQNAFVPGFNSGNKVLATVSYVCLLTGTIQYLNSKGNYDKYQSETEDSEARVGYYDKAISAQKQSKILIGAGIGLLATNLILARVYNKKYNLASLSYNHGAICLSYVHTIHF